MIVIGVDVTSCSLAESPGNFRVGATIASYIRISISLGISTCPAYVRKSSLVLCVSSQSIIWSSKNVCRPLPWCHCSKWLAKVSWMATGSVRVEPSESRRRFMSYRSMWVPKMDLITAAFFPWRRAFSLAVDWELIACLHSERFRPCICFLRCFSNVINSRVR